MRRVVVPVVATALLLALLIIGVFPTRSYFTQHQAISGAEVELANLTRTNDTAQAQVDRLQTDAEIEKQAREQYGLVKAGEEAYHVLPDPQDPPKVPDVWPFSRLQQRLDR
ncbi:MAG: septum formation initiator family protein [Actinomycetes bacterium]